MSRVNTETQHHHHHTLSGTHHHIISDDRCSGACIMDHASMKQPRAIYMPPTQHNFEHHSGRRQNDVKHGLTSTDSLRRSSVVQIVVSQQYLFTHKNCACAACILSEGCRVACKCDVMCLLVMYGCLCDVQCLVLFSNVFTLGWYVGRWVPLWKDVQTYIYIDYQKHTQKKKNIGRCRGDDILPSMQFFCVLAVID